VVDGVMENKNLRMKEKLYELSKKRAIYVLGGNHRLEAYKKEQRKRGVENNRFDSVLGQLYWWPDESPENVWEMRALATQNNIEGETRLEMSFWGKVHISSTLVVERAGLLILE